MRLRLYLRSAGDFVRRSEYRGLASQVRRALYSETAGVVVHKDLLRDPDALDREREPKVRPASTADLQALLDPDDEAGMDADDRLPASRGIDAVVL